MLVCLSGHLHRRIIINIAPRGFKIRRRRSYTVFPHIVSALEKFPPLNSFRTFMYCDQRSQYIRPKSKKKIVSAETIWGNMVCESYKWSKLYYSSDALPETKTLKENYSVFNSFTFCCNSCGQQGDASFSFLVMLF